MSDIAGPCYTSLMRIICWNVNGLRANVKKGGFDWFLNESPDIFCIQETKAQEEQLEDGVCKPAGYFSYFDHSKGRKGYSGVAIYSKTEPEKVTFGMCDDKYDQEGRLITAFYKDFVLLNIYFPNGGGGPERLQYKLEFYDKFLSYIDELKCEGKEIVFCGDVNTAHKEIDLARPKENENNTGFLPVEREWIDKVIAHGYNDVFRHFHPDVKDKYTYWDMKTFARDRNVGWRIDYFFASQGMLKKIKKIKIWSEILGSDHCPIEIDIG